MLEIKLHIITFGISITASVYTCLLTQPDMILEKWSSFLYEKLMKNCDGKYKFIHKIIVGCSYCFAGQTALWTYLLLFLNGFENMEYNLWYHILFISISIFNICIINKGRFYE